MLTDRTRWVAVTAASNAVGTVPDLPGIVAAAHAAGARVYVDAVHAAPHRRIDVEALGCDALACSAYKWFGPHIGILWGRPELLEELRAGQAAPVVGRGARTAGSSARSRSSRWPACAPPPTTCCRPTGTPSARTRTRCSPTTLDRARAAWPHVTVYGAARDRAPTLMFNVRGRTSDEVAAALADRQIAVWHGNYYAYELERHLGLAPHGAVRAGFVHYNDEADAERLLAAVSDLA